MDFRTLPRAYEGVQFPRCPATVSVSGAGQYRIQMRVPASSDLLCDFRDYLDAADAAAVSRVLDLSDGGDGVSVSSTVYDPDPGYRDPSVRLTAFAGSCTFFDADGAVTHDPVGAWDVACVASLDGTWKSATRVGVRWKVSQVKLYPAATRPATTRPAPGDKRKFQDADFLFVNDDAEYAFLD